MNYRAAAEQAADNPFPEAATHRPLFTEPDWFGRHVPMWREVLGSLLTTTEPVRCLEIGTYEGRSAIWIAENLISRNESSHLLCVDSFVGATAAQEGKGGIQGAELRERWLHNVRPYLDRVALVESSSAMCLRDLTGGHFCGSGTVPDDAPFDFVYVDGAHDALNCLRDSVLSFDLLKVGGRLIWDDYKWTRRRGHLAPAMAIDAFLDIYRGKLEVLHKGYQVAIVKTAEG